MVMQDAQPQAPAVPQPEYKDLRPFPASRTRTLLLTLIALGAGVGAAMGLESLRFERLSGTLQSSWRPVTSGRNAVIERLLVEPGAVVQPGDPLVLLSDSKLHERLIKERQVLAAIEGEVAQAEARVVLELDWRRKAIEAEIFETKLKSAQYLKQQFANQIESIAWHDILEELGQTSVTAKDEALPALLYENKRNDERRVNALLRQEASTNSQEVSAAQVELCDERLKQLEKLQRALPEQVRRSLGVHVIERRLAQAQECVKVLERRSQDLTLSAETTGIVGVFQKQPGEPVAAHEPIVQLLNEEETWVLVNVPSRRVADFTEGTLVELRFPGGKRGQGRVETLPPQAQADDSLSEPVLRAKVTQTGALWPKVPFGSTVDVRRRR